MSWLLRRSRPNAKSGYLDEFERTENPPGQPWRYWGDPTPAQIDGHNLVIQNSASLFGLGPKGGWGYEFQPLTPHWGIEWGMQLSNDALSKGFAMYISQNWTANQQPDNLKYQTYLNWYRYQTGSSRNKRDNWAQSLVLNDRDSTIDPATRAAWDYTNRADYIAYHTYRLRVISDRTFIMVMDGVPRWCYTIQNSGEDANYIPGFGRRGINMRCLGYDAYIDRYFVYDWVAGEPVWSAFFADDFQRANGAPGNGWTQLGASGQLSGGIYVKTGGTDGGAAIIRPTGITSGQMRITAVIASPSAHEAGLILCSNAAGTQGLAARVTTSNAKIFRYSTALTGNPPTWTQLGIFRAPSSSIATGHVLTFETRGDGTAFIWRGDEILAYAENVFANVAQSNSYAGCFVSRSLFTNSGGWDNPGLWST